MLNCSVVDNVYYFFYDKYGMVGQFMTSMSALLLFIQFWHSYKFIKQRNKIEEVGGVPLKIIIANLPFGMLQLAVHLLLVRTDGIADEYNRKDDDIICSSEGSTKYLALDWLSFTLTHFVILMKFINQDFVLRLKSV